MDEFAYIGRKHQYIAPCTDATSILYWHYKHLVLTLQASCSVCAKRFCCTANVVVLIHCWQSGVAEQLSKINPF